MSIALRNVQGGDAPVQRIEGDGNLRMLLVICGLITVPSLVLAVLLTGWVQYVFVIFAAINVAVPVLAYFASLNPPAPMPEEDYDYSRAPQIMVEPARLPLGEHAPVEKVSDKV